MTWDAHTGAASLRRLLTSGDFLALAGAHDALSARIAGRCGFPALWASGLGISAAAGVQDHGILGMREVLQASQAMGVAAGLPVLVDCDGGFGDVENVRQMVRLFEAGGIAGVCMEDKVYPKRNSLGGAAQHLEDVRVFAHKVEAAKATQCGSEFIVVARVEALVAGAGVEEAMRRAQAYAAAGADAVLMHSVSRRPDEIAQFAARWHGGLPLLVLPTTFPHVTEQQLTEMGIAGCIYANQALRACTLAMRRAFAALRRDRSASALEAEIAPVSEVLEMYETPARVRIHAPPGRPGPVLVGTGNRE
jgi:phosphoenolpyruvate phosphomutase